VRGNGLARGRALIACAACAVAAAVSGCAAAPTASTVSGGTLSIYLGSPPGPPDSRTQDVLAAEQLAFHQSGGTAGSFKLELVPLHGAKISDNARTAIVDKSAIAYIGEILPGQSADSLGIVGDQQVLQVSPTDTAVELTQGTPAVSGSPDIYYEVTGSSSRTFARVAPTTAREAKALLADAAALGLTKLDVVTDGSPYGTALAYAVKHAAGTSVAVIEGAATPSAFASSGAGALLYAGSDRARATALLDAVAAASPSAKLLAPSALDDQGFAAGLSSAAQQALDVSAPGFDRADLTATGRQFEAAFTARYGHAPNPQAIFGYEAMSAVIAVLREAGKNAGNRGTVRNDFFAIRNRASVLGTYSIDSSGDTSLAPFVISHVRAGTLTPYRYFSEQG
jgi:branched-chain amino acid transport system substrate-binding protein